MTSDIDSLRASIKPSSDPTSKLEALEGTVSRMDSEFNALRALIVDSTPVPTSNLDSRTGTTAASTAASEEGFATAMAEATATAALRGPPEMSGVTFGDDVAATTTSTARHPLFPEVDTATMHVHRGIDDDGGGIPLSRDTMGSSHPTLDAERPPFRQARMPTNPYPPHPYARAQSLGQQLHNSRRSDNATDVRRHDDDEEESMGGIIVSPRNADRRRDALAQRISPFDIARLGNVRYHGGVNGCYPLTERMIHRCGYTALGHRRCSLGCAER